MRFSAIFETNVCLSLLIILLIHSLRTINVLWLSVQVFLSSQPMLMLGTYLVMKIVTVHQA